MAIDSITWRNLIGFWLFGLCNNFAYVVMLSAAEDILDQQEHKNNSNSEQDCEVQLVTRQCSKISTGAVLLADILPMMFIKLTFPFFMHRIPYGVRHCFVVLTQAISFLIVAYSTDVWMSLLGVVFASIGQGLGEISFLALSSHFSMNTISAWSSGTGGAHFFGSLAYAGLTEPHLADVTPKTALRLMLIIPVLFAITFWLLVVMPKTVYRVQILKPSTYCERTAEKTTDNGVIDMKTSQKLVLREKFQLMRPILRYMIPFGVVYFGEYLINQGIVELIYFNCSHGFHLSRPSQYRWYQVLYQVGVFASRSSLNVVTLPALVLPFLAILQLCNAIFFFADSIYFFVPHISIVLGLILFEGLLGGASYVNTYRAIYKKVPVEHREFSLSAASMFDLFGIVPAGFLAIPLHNFVCKQPLH